MSARSLSSNSLNLIACFLIILTIGCRGSGEPGSEVNVEETIKTTEPVLNKVQTSSPEEPNWHGNLPIEARDPKFVGTWRRINRQIPEIDDLILFRDGSGVQICTEGNPQLHWRSEGEFLWLYTYLPNDGRGWVKYVCRYEEKDGFKRILLTSPFREHDIQEYVIYNGRYKHDR